MTAERTPDGGREPGGSGRPPGQEAGAPAVGAAGSPAGGEAGSTGAGRDADAGDGTLTRVEGLWVGHASDPEGLTGCTVILCPEGVACAADVRGGAPGTRETDLLGPGRLVQQVHGICLAGGSAFGLAAAQGVMAWLEERGYGFDTGVARVPIVPAAILFDLAVGDPRARPDAAMGYAACQAASREPVQEGSVGAGTGAVIGMVMGPQGARKGGVGSAARFLPAGWTVGALVVLNCYGGVRDPASGRWLVGPPPVVSTPSWPGAAEGGPGLSHTTLVVVATDAPLARDDLYRVAQVAQTGLARVIDPVHTWVDGDVVFALSTARHRQAPDMAGRMALAVAAAQVTAEAALRAALRATPLGGIPVVDAAGRRDPGR
ncbi:P1 family peptidase [Thermaerobacter sp. PB12/4term]|uniref:P1 family peptidase n=1 Tax=Thermaerobacter sp. PB12/4term TaxID=2293838 RepID=UPI001FAC2E4E|nr:P1 family peptidase [Thermaerobacter sp. PB12/4term]